MSVNCAYSKSFPEYFDCIDHNIDTVNVVQMKKNNKLAQRVNSEKGLNKTGTQCK